MPGDLADIEDVPRLWDSPAVRTICPGRAGRASRASHTGRYNHDGGDSRESCDVLDSGNGGECKYFG